MEKVLIVMQNSFPYLTGEPFFEKELPFLSKSFDSILIFSINGGNASPTRSMPSNCKSIPLNCTHNKKYLYLLEGFFIKTIFPCKEKSLKKRISAWYLRGKNISVYKKAIKALQIKNLIDCQIVIYSYWMTLGVASILLRNHLEKNLNKRIPYYSRGHGYDVYSEVMPFNYSPFQKEVIFYSDGVYICSSFGCNYLREKYPDCKNKINIARLGTDDYGIMPSNSNCETVLITVAGARPVKRLLLLVKSLSKLQEKTDNFRWVYIGDGEEFDSIKKLAKELNVDNKCIFLGSMKNTDVLDYYRNNSVDYFLLTSKSEGIPVSIMEASSFGIPTISTNVGGIGEIVDDDCGFLIPKDADENVIANVLSKALNLNKNEYMIKREKTRKKWEMCFSSKNNYEQWCNILLSK